MKSMKKSTKLLLALAIVAFATNAGVAYAQTGPNLEARASTTQGGPKGPPALRGAMGSTTIQGKMGSSTEKMKPDMGRAFPGIVTSVSADHFLMASRGMGANATTTFTVNVGSTTQYLHGTSTSAYSLIKVGTKVEVMGKLATSTNTITAARINFGVGNVGKMGPGGPHASTTASTTMPEHPGKGNGLLNKLMKFFKFGPPAPSTASTAPAAAAESDNSFVNSVIQALFGWL